MGAAAAVGGWGGRGHEPGRGPIGGGRFGTTERASRSDVVAVSIHETLTVNVWGLSSDMLPAHVGRPQVTTPEFAGQLPLKGRGFVEGVEMDPPLIR